MTTELAAGCDPAGLAAAHRAACFACRPADRGGLGLAFTEEPDGSVSAHFRCDARFQGHPDRLHGGLVATLLDAAMMHCLFARHVEAVTTRLEIRFRHPVEIGKEARLRAQVTDAGGIFYVARAELVQDGRVCSTGRGLFYAPRSQGAGPP